MRDSPGLKSERSSWSKGCCEGRDTWVGREAFETARRGAAVTGGGRADAAARFSWSWPALPGPKKNQGNVGTRAVQTCLRPARWCRIHKANMKKVYASSKIPLKNANAFTTRNCARSASEASHSSSAESPSVHSTSISAKAPVDVYSPRANHMNPRRPTKRSSDLT